MRVHDFVVVNVFSCSCKIEIFEKPPEIFKSFLNLCYLLIIYEIIYNPPLLTKEIDIFLQIEDINNALIKTVWTHKGPNFSILAMSNIFPQLITSSQFSLPPTSSCIISSQKSQHATSVQSKCWGIPMKFSAQYHSTLGTNILLSILVNRFILILLYISNLKRSPSKPDKNQL